jgi:hypothetical protein
MFEVKTFPSRNWFVRLSIFDFEENLNKQNFNSIIISFLESTTNDHNDFNKEIESQYCVEKLCKN